MLGVGQTLYTCKHDLLASFFTARPVPRPCCEAAGEVHAFCDVVTSSIVGVLLPRRLQKECDVINRHPSVRAPPLISFFQPTLLRGSSPASVPAGPATCRQSRRG